jgi:hypothetical protein
MKPSVMTIRNLFGLTAIAFTLFAATDGSAAPRASKTLDMRVGGVSIEQGKVRAALLSGADQGILPGDKGFFTKDGQKVPGSDFEVQRVGGRIAWTFTSFPTVDELRFRTSLTARVTAPSRTCTGRGTHMAAVTSTARESDSSFFFTLDKGTADGLMPSSVVAIKDGTVDITWVSEKSAGGYVRGVKNPDEAAAAFRRLPYEQVQCKAK